MNEFRYTSFAQEIIFGAGSLSRLGEAATHFGWRRLMLCTTGSQRREGTVEWIECKLAGQLVAIYEQVRSHVPSEQVTEAIKLAQEKTIDAVIGLGGGSPI